MGFYYTAVLFYGYVNGNDIYKKISYECSDNLAFSNFHNYNYEIVRNYLIKDSKKEHNGCLGTEEQLDWYLYTNCWDTYGGECTRGTVCKLSNSPYSSDKENILDDDMEYKLKKIREIKEETEKLRINYVELSKKIIYYDELDTINFNEISIILTKLGDSYKKYRSMIEIIEVLYIEESHTELNSYKVFVVNNDGTFNNYKFIEAYSKNPKIIENYLYLNKSETNDKIIAELGIDLKYKLITN